MNTNKPIRSADETRISNKARLLRMVTEHPRELWEGEIDPVATGKILCKHREALHLTQEDLVDIFHAAGAPVSRIAISRWENGWTVPARGNLVLLARMYGCRSDELVATYSRSRGAEDRDQPVPFWGEFLGGESKQNPCFP